MPALESADATAVRNWFRRHGGRVRGHLILAGCAGFTAGILIVAQAGLFAWIVHAAVSDAVSRTDLFMPLSLLVITILLRAGAQWLQEVAGLQAGIRVRQRVRGELLDHIGRLGPARLEHAHSAGLAGQVLDNIEALQGYYARFIPQLYLAAAVPLVILIVVFMLDWLAAVFLLIAAPLIPAFMVVIGMGAERLNREQYADLARLAGCFLDRVRGLATLQLFGHAGRSTQEVVAASEAYRRRSMRTLRVAFLSSAVLEFFSAVAIAVVAIYIGFGLLGFIEFGPAPELTLFTGLFILLLAPEFFQPLRSLSQHYHDRAAALGAADGLLALLERRVPPVSHEPPAPTNAAGVGIEIDAAEVHYPGRGCVLGPVSLAIAPGEVIAVAGPSGAGKTTLLHLLAGFRQPDAGRVLIDAIPPAGRGGFAWMDQRPFLIQGTIADNLRLAAPQATTADLLDAVHRAGLCEYLQQLPEGMETVVGERGAGLSGGQAQRLALARVFLSAAPLVLLDEPTACLDEYSERLVLESLRRLAAAGRTMIAASHHPAVLAMADRVIRLEAGRVTGTRDHG